MILSREVKTAIFILGCVAIFIFGYGFLKGTSLLDNSTQAYALYEDVEGLVLGANVTINGMKVGKINSIDFDENYDKIKVGFTLRNDLSFSKNSTAELYEAGLIGGKAIAIITVYDDSNQVQDGDILPSQIKPGLTELVNRQIAPLQSKIEGLLTSADSLFAGVSNVLNYETQNNLKITLENLTKSIQNVSELTNSMNRIVDRNEKNFKGTMNYLQATTKNLSQLTDSLNQMPLNATINSLAETAEDFSLLISRLESGEGTAGKLLNDDQLYTKLLGSSEALEALLNDLKANPKKYVHFSIFGRKETVAPEKN